MTVFRKGDGFLNRRPQNDLLRELQLFQGIVERKKAIQIFGNVLTVAITARHSERVADDVGLILS